MYAVFVTVLRFFFFKQKTAYELRISVWSSDVCSSDLALPGIERLQAEAVVELVPQLLAAAELQPAGELDGVEAERHAGEVVERGALADPVVGRGVHDVGVAALDRKIGRASCRERVCQYV